MYTMIIQKDSTCVSEREENRDCWFSLMGLRIDRQAYAGFGCLWVVFQLRVQADKLLQIFYFFI